MSEPRLGDDIDDFCIKCKRLSNHLIVSLLNGAAAKVRCRSCYSEHDYRHEQAPPTKKELKKLQMAAAAEAEAALNGGEANSEPVLDSEATSELPAPAEETPSQPKKKK